MITEIKNYLRISASLACAGQPMEEELRFIKKAGFEVVINLGLLNQPEYSLKDEAGSVRALGMDYIHIPVVFEHPLRRNLVDFFGTLEANKGKNTLVHCAMNMRASAFIGLYSAIRLKQLREQAFAPMRRIWEPDTVWQAFFESMLADPLLK